MGDDVRIIVAEVADAQPLSDTDDVFIIVDQYGEEHLTEMDGDTWVPVMATRSGAATLPMPSASFAATAAGTP